MSLVKKIIADKITGSGLTQEQLSQQLGFDPSYLSKLLREKTSWPDPGKSPIYRELSEILDIPLDVLEQFAREENLQRLQGKVKAYAERYSVALVPVQVESERELRSVPILSWVQAGQWTENTDGDFPAGQADDYVQTGVAGDHVFALRVQGDSMEPEFLEGDIIIINPDLQVDHGDYAIVKRDRSGETTFKRVLFYADGEVVVLEAANPRYPKIELGKDEPYHIIGRVMEKKKRY